jgi:hypothetical protein
LVIRRTRPRAGTGRTDRLTVNEFRRLFDALLLGAKHTIDTLLLGAKHTIDTLLAWSRWRRRHQARARECHYRRHLQQR